MSDLEQTREQLLDIIATEGMVDRAKLTPDATIEDIGMASYDMVMILMAIEEKFGVYLSVDTELTDVKTLDELLTVLSTRIEAQKNAPPESAPGADGASSSAAGGDGATGAADAGTPAGGASASTPAAAAAAATTMGTPAAAATVTPVEPVERKSEAEAS